MITSRKLSILMQRVADLVSTGSYDPTRSTCFVSYHDADFSEVESFIRQFGAEFIPRCIGVTEQDGFVGSLDDRYIMSRVREEKLGDSTVTIVLLGSQTWHQRFVDWEVAASLRDGPVQPRSGILAMPLPSMSNRAILPERIMDNFGGAGNEKSCVVYESYAVTRDAFREKLARADAARSDASREVNNSRPLRRTDSPHRAGRPGPGDSADEGAHRDGPPQ